MIEKNKKELNRNFGAKRYNDWTTGFKWSFKIKLNQPEERICELEHIICNYLVRGAKWKKTEKDEESLWDLWNTNNINNVCIIGITEGKEREKGNKSYLKK